MNLVTRQQRGIYRDGFFKVSRRLLDSTLWCEESDVIKVFMALLALSQDPSSPRDGTVLISDKQLAAKCFLSADRLTECIKVLSGPDPRSRTARHNGQRVETLENGYRLVNHTLYHDKVSDRMLSRARAVAGRLGGVNSAKARAGQVDTSKQTAKQTRSKSKLQRRDREGEETETENTENNNNSSMPSRCAAPQPVQRLAVFDHWRTVMARPKARLDEKRRKAVDGRLRDGYSVEDLCRAVDGCRRSAWHQGANDRGRKYDDLELICRDSKHVDQFLDIATNGEARPMSRTTAHNLRALGMLDVDAPPALPEPKPEDE